MTRKTKIHLPHSYYGNEIRKNEKIETNLPIIFLAGPIRNAPKWQEAAIRIFLERNESLFIASPTRELGLDLMQLLEQGEFINYEAFSRQRAWEQYYLYSASKKGCIIFYLPKELEEKEFSDKLYAHITMMEIGEWIARCKTDKKINIVIGTDGNFPEWSTIEFEIKSELPEVQICSSLKETIETALNLCRKTNLIF